MDHWETFLLISQFFLKEEKMRGWIHHLFAATPAYSQLFGLDWACWMKNFLQTLPYYYLLVLGKGLIDVGSKVLTQRIGILLNN